MKKCTPSRQLLGNTSGSPRIYVRTEELPDLNWPAIGVEFDEEEEREQAKAIAQTYDGTKETQGSKRDVTPRQRRPPAWMKGYI